MASGSRAGGVRLKTRRKAIAEILRAAYHRHTRDIWTRRAVKRVLR
jgi:hypothetical protein